MFLSVRAARDVIYVQDAAARTEVSKCPTLTKGPDRLLQQLRHPMGLPESADPDRALTTNRQDHYSRELLGECLISAPSPYHAAQTQSDLPIAEKYTPGVW